jgi:hypothetical protein
VSLSLPWLSWVSEPSREQCPSSFESAGPTASSVWRKAWYIAAICISLVSKASALFAGLNATQMLTYIGLQVYIESASPLGAASHRV